MFLGQQGEKSVNNAFSRVSLTAYAMHVVEKHIADCRPPLGALPLSPIGRGIRGVRAASRRTARRVEPGARRKTHTTLKGNQSSYEESVQVLQLRTLSRTSLGVSLAQGNPPGKIRNRLSQSSRMSHFPRIRSRHTLATKTPLRPRS